MKRSSGSRSDELTPYRWGLSCKLAAPLCWVLFAIVGYDVHAAKNIKKAKAARGRPSRLRCARLLQRGGEERIGFRLRLLVRLGVVGDGDVELLAGLGRLGVGEGVHRAR